MKLKILSIAFSFVLALALASCGSKDGKPTGDPAKDFKTLAEKIKSVKTVEDAKEANKLNVEFDEFYKEKGGEDLKKWENECQKMQNDPELMQAAFKVGMLLLEDSQSGL